MAEKMSALRRRMIEDMTARQLSSDSQRSHIRSCKRFAAFLGRSPSSASRDDIRDFQLHLAKGAVSISTRNAVMSGVKFLFRVTLRRLDLAEGIYHLPEPQKAPVVKHLGARIGITSVLHSWGSAMTHHLLPGSGLHRKPRKGPHPYDRAWRRHLDGWIRMGFLSAQLLLAGTRPLASIPRPDPARSKTGPAISTQDRSGARRQPSFRRQIRGKQQRQNPPKASIPHRPRQAKPKLHPTISYLGASSTLQPGNDRPTRMIGVGETCTIRPLLPMRICPTPLPDWAALLILKRPARVLK